VSTPKPELTPTIAAVLLPGERPTLEAAGSGCFRILHRDTVPEAITAVRERSVDAVVLSVHRCGVADADAVRHLVRAFPGLPAVALMTRPDPGAAEALLRLGASGVRDVIDVTAPAGWRRLRYLVTQPATRPASRILGPLLERLPALPDDARMFLEAVVRLAPSTPTVRALAKVLGVGSSTLMSRFGRAGLPSAKRYLAAVRLVYAAQYLESGGLSIADVAYRLECSSPQSFGRHVRSLLGITCSEFRRRFPFPVALERFLTVMIDPYEQAWMSFHPLSGGETAVRARVVADVTLPAGPMTS
jgi:AraC-like DNA-binding protein